MIMYKYTEKYLTELYDFLVDNLIATEDELSLITSINGYSVDTLNDVLYYRTGYRDYEQYLEVIE